MRFTIPGRRSCRSWRGARLLAAIAHFPDRGHAVEELARRDEEFLLLCADLAEAEAALGRWERADTPVREARCAEYRELVRDLALEVEATLDRNA
jgi:hypothetical protein